MLTVAEFAAKYRLHPRTVRLLIARGEVPAVRVGVRRWRITPEAEAAWLEARSNR